MEKNERDSSGVSDRRACAVSGKDLKIYDTIFDDGESPLKESRNIELYGSMFKWKYPLWYAKDIKAVDCTWFEMARAGVWYTDRIEVTNAVIEAPKNFRRCNGLKLTNVTFPNASERCGVVRMWNWIMWMQRAIISV